MTDVELEGASINSQPMRLQCAVSPAARERLAVCVDLGNVDKVRSAPVVAIVGQDLAEWPATCTDRSYMPR